MSVTAAYIHVPFCRHRCGYCDFSLVAGKDHLIDRYLACLEKDLASRHSSVETLFLGGGTPSHLSVEQTEQLLSVVNRRFSLRAEAEFSLEANPLDLTDERLKVWKRFGVTRVSLGVQSFDSENLAILERDHRRDDIHRAVKLLKDFGFIVSLDLIFGIPGQTLAEWETALEEGLTLEPDHISTYGLTFEKGTSFWTRRERGALESASDEVEREMYGLAMDLLGERGFQQYEISNFARPGQACRHNLVYWNGDEYFGHGPGAASYLNGTRSTNHRSVTTWLSRIERGLSPIADQETLEPEHRARELLFLGLRRNAGIERSDFQRQSGYNLDEFVGSTIGQHVRQGLLEDTEDRIRLTREGRFLADTVVADYLG